VPPAGFFYWHPVCFSGWWKDPGGGHPMREFKFEPIEVNSTAPGGAGVLRTFDDIGAFILNRVDIPRRLAPHWHAVRQDLAQARFGARREEKRFMRLCAKHWRPRGGLPTESLRRRGSPHAAVPGLEVFHSRLGKRECH
jgi:hypothetical protein